VPSQLFVDQRTPLHSVRLRQIQPRQPSSDQFFHSAPPEFSGGTTPEFSALAIPASISHLWGWGSLMSPHISGWVASRDRSLRYWLVGCSLVLAIVSILISIGASAGTIWAAAAPSNETINRAPKGDRLPLALTPFSPPASGAMEGNVSRLSVDLPDGCEALASPLARSAVANIAGRCVS
jgi:hypothetical protein